MKQVRYKRTCIVRFHLYDVPRINTEDKIDANGGQREGDGKLLLNWLRVLFKMRKSSGNG